METEMTVWMSYDLVTSTGVGLRISRPGGFVG
jgi:hypothetical protein